MSEQPSRASLREDLEPYGEIGQRVLEALAPTHAPPAKLTFEAFLDQYDGQFAEWVNGEVIMAGPAGLEHQDISGFLQAVLRAFVEARGLGRIVAAPFAMWIGASAREPEWGGKRKAAVIVPGFVIMPGVWAVLTSAPIICYLNVR